MHSTLLACAVLVSLNAFTLATPPTTKRAAGTDDHIVYPGPTREHDEIHNRYSGNDDVPEECQGKTYCTVKPPNYPEERYNQMFKSFKGAPSPPVLGDMLLFPSRQGDPDDKDDCESIVTYEPLYKVKEVETQAWRIVVQAPKSDYVQRVRLETCKNTEASCFTSFMPTSQYSTFCKQKYNTWQVTVDDGKGGTELIKTELPVCCSCHYKPTSVTSRLGQTKKN